MAVAYDGGVIVGADSRTSTGAPAVHRLAPPVRPPLPLSPPPPRPPTAATRFAAHRGLGFTHLHLHRGLGYAGVYVSNRVSDKITGVDERIYVCRSGSAADTQAVSDYVTHYLNQHRMQYGQPPKVESAANVFNQLCYHNKNALTAGIIVAGWDKQKGGQVFAIPVGGGLLPRPFAIGGSGSTYIYGFCDAYYRPGMNQQQCEEFVTKALCHAMARDGSSGGVIRTVRIDESGVERKMIAGNKLPYGPL